MAAVPSHSMMTTLSQNQVLDYLAWLDGGIVPVLSPKHEPHSEGLEAIAVARPMTKRDGLPIQALVGGQTLTTGLSALGMGNG